MLKKGEHIEGTPAELQVLLDQDAEASIFFLAFPNLINKAIVTGWVQPNRKKPGKFEQTKP